MTTRRYCFADIWQAARGVKIGQKFGREDNGRRVRIRSTCCSLASPFVFIDLWPQDDLGARSSGHARSLLVEERTNERTNDFVACRIRSAIRALIWPGVREKRKASKEKCRRENRTLDTSIKAPRDFSPPVCIPWKGLRPCCLPSSCPLVRFFSVPVRSADVTLGCLVDGVFCAVERHNDTLSKNCQCRRMQRIGFHGVH